MKKIIVAYIPVLHEGYRRFFENHKDAKKLYIFGPEITKKFDYLKKEIRALDPELIKKSIESWGVFDKVFVLDGTSLKEIQNSDWVLVMPDEDVTKELAEEYFSEHEIEFDSVFLRWDKHKTMEERPVEADQTISVEDFDKELIKNLKKESEKSSDWWRRIASAIVKDGEIILTAHNEHLPSHHSPFSDSDPRINFHKGVGIEYSTSIHSEARLIAEAAKAGIPLDGASIYATVFPCPPCAKQIAFSGIKKLYYSGGYSLLNQESILKSKGVEIIFVDLGN